MSSAAAPVPTRLAFFHGLGSIAYGVKDNGFSTFLLLYYNQVLGMDAKLVGAALALALIAITFNTIRLQILTQRDEIEVAKLIGATDGWIQRPFLYFGGLIGMAGGIAAWLLTALALLVFNNQLGALAGLYGVPLKLTHLAWADSLFALLFAAGLGWFGAWLSVRRHLSEIGRESRMPSSAV